ncbi:flocculation protein FLO11 [Drosophila obscura]|uniref:flocculation protein FLO11 n=1 Tax=Drosophila obscura TaxID=7282 RepID=UPI001BB2C31B|nr:flocculation protein FLO11 [Drosophila obscura]
MQLASSTEAQPPPSVTPMKLRALAKSTTPLPFASNENAIEESTSTIRQMPEKRAKFISENSTNAQQLLLPNTAEVWSLAGMKSVPKSPTLALDIATPSPEHATARATATENSTTIFVAPFLHANSSAAELTNDIEEPPQNQTELHQEKNLLDWQQIALMQAPPRIEPEFAVSTTLDATEEAMQGTTESLEESSATPEKKETTTVAAGGGGGGLNLTTSAAPARVMETTTVARESMEQEVRCSHPLPGRRPQPVSVQRSLRQTAAATAATTESSAVQHVSPVGAADPQPDPQPDPDPEMTTTAITSSIDGVLSARNEANSSPSPSPNTTEMAMKAANESDDVINVVSPGAPQSERPPEREQQQQQQQQATNPTTTAVSIRATVEESASTATTATATVPQQSKLTAAAAAAEEATTEGATTEGATPTQNPTEIVQISNEVNLETATVPAPPAPAGATAEPVSKSKEEQKEEKEKEEATGTTDDSSARIKTKTDTSGNNFVNNSVAQSITEAATEADAATSSSSSRPATASRQPEVKEDSTQATPLFSDLGTKQENNEHESSLETNNIGEAAEEATAATTTSQGLATATATTATTAAAGPAAGPEAPALNALDERETGKTATGAKGPPLSSSSASSDEHYDEENDTGKGQQQVDEVHGKQVIIEEQQPQPKQTLAKNMAGNGTSSTTEEAATRSSSSSSSTTAKTTTEMQPPLISLLDDTTTISTTKTTTLPTPTEVSSSSSSSSMLPENTTLAYAPPGASSSSTTEDSFLPSILPSEPAATAPPPIIMAAFPNDLPAQGGGTDVNVIIAITVSVIGVVALILLVAFLYLMRKRQKQMSYGQRCRPVSLDAYSLDNVSVLGSVRRKGRDLRASKRTYGNAAFDDPSLRHNLLSAAELGRFVERRSSIFEEFRDVPQIIARADEVPAGCEDRNRYANVIPLPETRVVLQRRSDDDKTEYINANYVRGPRDAPNYYIACQAPMESTTSDFWRMIWEQQSRVIIQATDLSENGIEKCAEYLPPSATLDNHSSYGDYQVTLKNREVKDKYAISTLMLKRVDGEECRELTHYWYKWPEAGVPAEEAPIIAMLLEARSSLKSYCLEQQASDLKEKSSTVESSVDAEAAASAAKAEQINGNVGNSRGNSGTGTGTRSQQGPLTVHCSPGTGRTGTIIASDMAIRSLETPKRSVDIPQLVYYVRRGRASAVQTKEQYEFIYKVANMYATKITNLSNDN